jgi:hypothetical protein
MLAEQSIMHWQRLRHKAAGVTPIQVNGRFHVVGLSKCSNAQSNSGNDQNDGCLKKTFGEKSEFTSKFNNLGVRLLVQFLQ